MYAISLIKRHIWRLPLGKIFTTREMLLYGTRTAVDQALSRLVREEVIVRLTRGVFVRAGTNVEKITVDDVARVKAESFGKQVVPWPGQFVTMLGLAVDTRAEPVYCVNGSSSSFRFRGVTVQLRKLCPRRMHLTGSAPGQFLSAIWHMGQSGSSLIKTGYRSLPWLGRTERYEIRRSAIWLPSWLADIFANWSLPYAVVRGETAAPIPAGAWRVPARE